MDNNIGACNTAQKYRSELYVALRVMVGLIFFYHGYQKVFVMGTEAVTGFFASIGIPMASLLAPLVSYGELLGGIALILGLFTHWVAKLNVVIMLGAIFYVHLANGFADYEFQLLLIIANLFIAATGAGMYSLDRKRALKAVPSM